jgi:hypothetical protein
MEGMWKWDNPPLLFPILDSVSKAFYTSLKARYA